MIVGIVGKPGTGKTLLMSILGNITRSKHKIVSNYHLNFESELLDIEKLFNFEYKNCILLIDEIYTYLESRLSHSNINISFSHFIFQIRKRNITLIFSAQLQMSYDIRLRQLVDVLIFTDFDSFYFNYRIYNMKNINLSKIIRISKLNAQKHYSLYDTNEIIQQIQSTDNKLLFELKSIDEKQKKIDKIIDDIQKKYPNKRYTKSLIKRYLFEQQLPAYLLDLLHSYLNVQSEIIEENQ